MTKRRAWHPVVFAGAALLITLPVFSSPSFAQAPAAKPATRTAATPGLEALARKLIEGDAKGRPALDLMSPEMAQAAQAQRDTLTKEHARSGPLKSLTFKGPTPDGGDIYIGVFEYASRDVAIKAGADGKVVGFGMGPFQPQTAPQRAAAFKAIDLNKDGKLDKPEYGTMLTTIGFPTRLDNFFAQLDADKNGFISTKEFEKDPQ